MDQLRDKCRKLFDLPDNRVWYFKWTDDDGDSISLTEDHEFRDLIGSNTSNPIRLAVYFPPTPSVDTFIVFTLPFVHHAVNWFGDLNRAAFYQQTQSQGEYVARCDNTNKLLSPGNGDWYHLLGTSVDLCKAEFDRIDESLKPVFVEVRTADDLKDDKRHYLVRSRGCPFKQQSHEQGKTTEAPHAEPTRD